jgi:hypothetical protein
MSMQFLAPARATDLIAIGRVLRRGKTLVNVDVDVVSPDGEPVAKAIATYKVGRIVLGATWYPEMLERRWRWGVITLGGRSAASETSGETGHRWRWWNGPR